MIDTTGTAIKMWIKDVLTAKYTPGNDQTQSVLQIQDKKIIRVNIICVVVNKIKQETIQTIDLEDGTGKIQARTFDTTKNLNVEVGDCIFLIGKPREYNNQKYIAIEITKKINQPEWIEVRKKEIPLPVIQTEIIAEKNKEQIIEQDEESSKLLQIITLIKQNDEGNGAEYEKIIQDSKIPNTEQMLQTLLRNGEIFKVSPGKIKVLE